MRRQLYFAYGSNMNVRQMAYRCPDADPVGYMYLDHWRLVFRGVADIVPDGKARCPGGVWVISEEDERKLDLYEGVRSGLYRKVYLPIEAFRWQGFEYKWMLVYVMNSTGIFPPSQYYLDGIVEGYRDFHMPEKGRKLLDAALQAAWDDKRPSNRERERYLKKGTPKLARPSKCNNCGFCPRKPQGEQLQLDIGA